MASCETGGYTALADPNPSYVGTSSQPPVDGELNHANIVLD
jgi:hypothetical protein